MPVCGRREQRLLPAGPRELRSHCHHDVSRKTYRTDDSTDHATRALFVVYLGYSIWCCIPTEAESVEREADRRADLEMKKLSMYSDGHLTKEERREQNRQLFMNLPKTPNTPGFGVHNPMTPRTTAFTQLNGGEVPMVSKAGPSRSLPFREYELQEVSFNAKSNPNGR